MLLLLLFVGYYGSITLFPHNHLINGKLVSHSHPFQSKPHSHTTGQIHLLDSLSNIQSSQPTSCAIPEVYRTAETLLSIDLQKTYHYQAVATPSLRAPPAQRG